MADPRKYVAGSSSLVMGANSYTLPTNLGEQEYSFGQNVVCRGGILQTRPGTRSLFCLPDGNFQGATLFTPDNGVPQLVFAVDGKIYVSAAPFTSYRRLFNLQFSITAKYLAWAVCLKSTDYDLDGNLYSLEDPFSVLVMQDGLTRAAYWDGGTSRHLNPTPATDITDVTDAVIEGYNETPIGLWMIWSGNRLWVSRGNQIFASDIGNPLKFTESLYLNEGRAFNLSGPCTGMIEVPSDSAGAKGFIAFTEKDGTLFASYIQDRLQWLTTPLFQNTILPNVGCVAPRSLVTQYGLNWWFSARGLTNVNAAFRQNLSSRIDYQDNQMFASKAYLGPDLSGICASYYENYLMCSVPSGDVLNRHTWVLDQAPFDGNANAWTGIWTGWKPIEWCRGIINGSERVFFGSIDYDGKNRIWEAMLPERTDNGCRITCYAQLRDHAAGNLDQKRYEWSKFFLSQIYGDVDLNIYVASTKGGYQLQKNYHLVASEGQVFMDTEYSENGPFLIGNRVQTRTIRTPSNPDDNECNACGVESKEGNMIDYAFTHLLVWSGQMGIRAYQMHMRESPERQAGDCEEHEVGPRTLNAHGCSGLQLLVDTEIFEQYTASAEGMMTLINGASIYIRRTSISYISQENAQSLADCAIVQIKNALVEVALEDGVYDSTAAEVGDGTYLIVSGGTQDACDEPEIDSQPQDADVLEDGTTEFSVSASGSGLTYQWQVSTNGGSTWSNISNGAVYSGVTTDTLTVLVADIGMDNYEYRCVVSNDCSSVPSEAAVMTVTEPNPTRILMVAGGGGGGLTYGGAGGGGEVIVDDNYTLDTGISHAIVVGAGGAGSVSRNTTGTSGGDTTFDGMTAAGGGGGGSLLSLNAGNGGCGGGGGGGGAVAGVGNAGAGGTGSGGGNGGNGTTNATTGASGGGGGGAGGNGNVAPAQDEGGDGGVGISSDISGTEIAYGGGGGGGSHIDEGGGLAGSGTDGGGNGATFGTGSPGGSNRGGGGGGGGWNGSSDGPGGAGGTGVVVIRYSGSPVFTGGTITTVGLDTVHTFSSSGSLDPI